MWLKRLQIAVIEKNIDELGRLLDEPLEFKNKDEIKSAMYLLAEAFKIVQEMKDETASVMLQLKKNIDFLKSTQGKSLNRLDIRL